MATLAVAAAVVIIVAISKNGDRAGSSTPSGISDSMTFDADMKLEERSEKLESAFDRATADLDDITDSDTTCETFDEENSGVRCATTVIVNGESYTQVTSYQVGSERPILLSQTCLDDKCVVRG